MLARRRQHGVILLTLMLVILATGSYVLLKALNVAANNPGYDEAVTRAALNEAKQALIGYSVSYPERTDSSDRGPGRLPCPDYQFSDTSGDPELGSADSCSLGADTETGLFPWYTIDSNEMRDGSGARLWYAVSDVHRSNVGGVVNSETVDITTPMRVDGAAEDVVAVIIAPGPPLGSQARGSELSVIYNPANYLEGENASRGDNVFISSSSGEFNDQLVTITRHELTKAVEERVLGDAIAALNSYHAAYGAYPWLRDFGDPDTIESPSPIVAPTNLTMQGHVPIHQVGQEFDANFRLTWDITSGEVCDGAAPPGICAPPSSLPGECARRNACADSGHTFLGSTLSGPAAVEGAADSTWGQGWCIWSEIDKIECTATQNLNTDTGPVTRTYQISIDGVEPEPKRSYQVSINGIEPSAPDAPTDEADRLQDFTLSGELLTGATIEIEVQDNSATITKLTVSDGDSVSALNLTGVPFYLATYDHTDPAAIRTPGDLPHWFTANDWHKLLLVAYASTEGPSEPGGTGCISGLNCLSLHWDRTGKLPDVTLDDLPGVVIMAGSDFGTDRPSDDITHYYEDENRTASDGLFLKSSRADVNDTVRRLDPNE